MPTAYAKRVDLSFREAPVRSIFDTLSRASGVNFYFDKDIRPDLRATVNARGTTVEEALRALLATNQLEQKVLNDTNVLIYPNTAAKQKEYLSLVVRSFYLARADAKQVAQTLRSILKTRDLSINERLNLIIVRDSPQAVRLAERLIALEDMGDSEVMLELEVLEVKRSRLQSLGIRWPNQLVLSAPAADGASFTLRDLNNLNSSNIGVTLADLIVNARRDDGDSNLLANPRIRVRNREKAKVLIGDKAPVITTTSTATGFVADSVSYVDVGLKLEVEPTIDLDDDVAIRVNLEVSSLVREVQTRSGTLAYQIGSRTASTVLRLRDGETQVLAGLISDEDRRTASRVPGLGGLPLLGRLFSTQQDDAQKTEIVLSITPRVVRGLRKPDLIDAQFDAGTEASPGP